MVNLNYEVFTNENGVVKDIKAGEGVVVPLYFSEEPCIDLTTSDIAQFDLEDRLILDAKMPTFFLYYLTVHGEILGKLFFTEKEMIFDPLNETLKGIYPYEFGDLLTNHKMGFIVNFEDIVGDPILMSLPEDEEDPQNTLTTSDVQIGLKHTGN